MVTIRLARGGAKASVLPSSRDRCARNARDGRLPRTCGFYNWHKPAMQKNYV